MRLLGWLRRRSAKHTKTSAIAPCRHSDRDLVLAAKLGDIGAARSALAAGADVHAEADAALRAAAERGLRDIVAMLLAAGADVHAGEDMALRLAALEGHCGVVEALIAAGANVRAESDIALRYAAIQGHRAVVEALVAAGSGFPVETHCLTILRVAFNGHSDIVGLMLSRSETWPAGVLAKLEAGPCGLEVHAWRARRALACTSASIIELAAP